MHVQILLTPKQGAAALAVCEAKFAQLTKSGEIPSLKIGRARRVRLVDLERYAERLAGSDAVKP